MIIINTISMYKGIIGHVSYLRYMNLMQGITAEHITRITPFRLEFKLKSFSVQN